MGGKVHALIVCAVEQGDALPSVHRGNHILEGGWYVGGGEQGVLQCLAGCAGAVCNGDDEFRAKWSLKLIVTDAHAHGEEEFKIVKLDGWVWTLCEDHTHVTVVL